ncbi:MAG: enoyl-CoA hydratase/isomerase family protein [Chitinophagales bacterium]|nr:enoyl-CoA hydratase/isomerase family protein [Chitinophagales bacterium]
MFLADQLHNFNEHTFAYIETELKDHCFTITLNRPEKKNALTPVFFKELAYALEYAAYKREIWAVVVAAKGDVFCAGADLKSFAGEPEQTNSTVPDPGTEIVIGNVFNALHKPCIAKVHAPVYAGGFLIICGCTHVIAANDAVFGLPEVKRGLFPFQVMQSMLQIMPPRTVLDFCMRAKTVNAAEAEKIGLISKATAKENLDAEVNALVEELFQYSPSGIRLGLEAFDNLKNVPPADAHKYLKQMLGEALQTEDAAEGLQAFIEKRKPVWKG